MKVQGLLMVCGLAAAVVAPAFAAEPVSRDEVRAIVSEMMADAESRSTLQGGGTAGYDKGFFLASSDNKFRLNVSGYTQFRYTANYQDKNNTAAGSDGFSHGFGVRRGVIAFTGNAGSEDINYKVRINSNNGADVILEDAWASFGMGGGWKLRAGQYRSAFFKEANNADQFSMATERSIVHSAFGQSYGQGLGLVFNSDQFDFMVDFSDGIGAGNTNRSFLGDRTGTTTFNTDLNPGGVQTFGAVTTSAAADYSVVARGEFTFAGDKKNLQDYTSKQDEKFAGNVGFSGLFEGSANNGNATLGTNNDVSSQLMGATIDAQVEGNGFGAFVAVVGTSRNFSSADAAFASAKTLTDFGLVAQANYRFLPNSEFFGRYEMLMLDKDHGGAAGAATKKYQFVTAGFTQYIVGNTTKFTVDAVTGLNRTASDANQTRLDGVGNIIGGTGLGANTLGLTGTNRGIEVALRAQLQVSF